MWSDQRCESPLVGFPFATVPASSVGACDISERQFLELTLVRGDASLVSFRDAVRAVTGAEVPVVPNTMSASADYRVFWMGPDEWLIQSATPRLPALEQPLRTALSGQFAAVVDVSSGYTVFQLRGAKARAVLEKGCPLDLHPREFKLGQCAQSQFFKADVLLYRVDEQAWELVVRRSFADYAARILKDATSEYLA
jgi:sarcosine oxidase subunit gamma